MSMSNLAVLMNDDQERIKDFTKQINQLTPKYRTIGVDGKVYEDKNIGAEVAKLVKDRLDLQKNYDARKVHYDNITSMISVYEQTKDTVIMSRILKQGQALIKSTIEQAGGIAAIKDTMEETSQMMFTASTINNLAQTPLASSTPTSSSSIQVDVVSPDNEEFKHILLTELNKHPAISTFPQVPSTSPRPKSSSSLKRLQPQVQVSPPVLLRKKPQEMVPL